MFITIHDEGRIYDVLGNWPVKDVKVCQKYDTEKNFNNTVLLNR
jgi:hypothetical protein